MKKHLLIWAFCMAFAIIATGQPFPTALDARHVQRCATEISIEQALKKDPSLMEKWRKEGQRQYAAAMQRKLFSREIDGVAETEIVIPVVFHLIDDSARLSGITDRDIYRQVELMNEAFSGKKANQYQKVIPKEMFSRLGSIPVRFVLARRTPSGQLTSGIERRVNTTPGRIAIKATNTGGLDAWDTDKYLNIWAGSFSGDDSGLLGVATPPFYTSEGPQGVVISLFTIPYSSNTSRSYYPAYSEGVTLVHEVGHYFYLWHTFGDSYECNNNDFRIQPGWPLPAGAGPEGDDTPSQKADSEGDAHYGNPSQNYSDGCAGVSYGMMYGSFMNYFDDRALFMFSNGMKNRVIGCIDLYRSGLKSSMGGTPPAPVTDAYLVKSLPEGSPERRTFVANNTPLSVVVRNLGTTTLNQAVVHVKMDNNAPVSYPFSLNVLPGKDTVLSVGTMAGANGTHTLTMYTSLPNGVADAFPQNDTIQSFIAISDAVLTAPFVEEFTSSVFPPNGWKVWNPNNNTTWERNAASGFTAAGAATVQNYNYNGGGQLDELITPQISTGAADSSLLSFRVAYKVYDARDVSLWDGLEIYVSNNKGVTYNLVYKKSGNQLRTTTAEERSGYTAPPSIPGNWRLDTVNLTPFLKAGENLIIKFRNVTAHGNNLYLDDIAVSAHKSLNRDVVATNVANVPEYICSGNFTPSVTFRSDGADLLTSLKINYQINSGEVKSVQWNGSLTQAASETIALPAIQAPAPGEYTLTVFTSQPNGLADQYPVNDTIRRVFYAMGQGETPIKLDFESSVFPPSQWVVANPDKQVTWEKTNAAAATGNGSMVIKNFHSSQLKTIDNFMSPLIRGNDQYDSLFVSFDYAYATGLSAGAGTLWDTLEVAVTMDCGKTFTTVWKKFGTELQTVQGFNTAAEFIANAEDFRQVRIPLYQLVGKRDFQVFFISKANHHNNLYIDNVEIYGKTVPPRLKEQGYLIYPSPFTSQFIIRNYEEPLSLKSAALFNSMGQRVWYEEYNGNAYKEIQVQAGHLSRGLYTLKLFYTDKVIVEKIMKQ